MVKSDANPIHPVQRLRDAPRCHATAKSTGEGCKATAVRGWRVCRMHGAGGGHGAGEANPAYKHGLRTREWVAIRRVIGELSRM